MNKTTYTIKFDHIYEFDFSNQVQFGDLPEDLMYKILRDGRVASKFLENYLPIWFPELKFVDKRGHDHVDAATETIQYDLKGFTKSGCKFMPSRMLGGGRKIVKEELKKHADHMNYIISDITQFPKVRVIFKHGSWLVDRWTDGIIPLKQIDVIFPMLQENNK